MLEITRQAPNDMMIRYKIWDGKASVAEDLQFLFWPGPSVILAYSEAFALSMAIHDSPQWKQRKQSGGKPHPTAFSPAV